MNKTTKKYVPEINEFELEAWSNQNFVCGIDEAGRGPLFGPMTIGCVVLPQNTDNQYLIDSKKLSESARNKAYNWILQNAFYHVVSVPAETLDKKNINHATGFAIKKLLHEFFDKYPFLDCSKILIDHVKIDFDNFRSIPIFTAPKGETWSNSIAAASIVAKVFRDNLVDSISSCFPAFSLSQHKGYATALHTKELLTKGRSVWHRKKYCDTLEQNLANKLLKASVDE